MLPLDMAVLGAGCRRGLAVETGAAAVGGRRAGWVLFHGSEGKRRSGMVSFVEEA